MPEYYNPWPHTVELVGPGGDRIRIKGKSTKTLNEYFDIYVERGHIEKVGHTIIQVPQVQSVPQVQINVPVNKIETRSVVKNKTKHLKQQKPVENVRKTSVLSQPRTFVEAPKPVVESVQTSADNVKRATRQTAPEPQPQNQSAGQQIVLTSKGFIKKPSAVQSASSKNLHVRQPSTRMHLSRNKVVGKQINGDALAVYSNNITSTPYRISNGVAICILSYNRGNSLLRLVESIRKTVDLDQVVIFISDDCSTDPHTISVLNSLNNDPKLVIIYNDKNIGISGNTNRLLRCAQRFEHIFLLNDDVQFIRAGWDQFYIQKSRQAGVHHACYRQPGVYGAKALDFETVHLHGVQTEIIHSKPHGAMLYITNEALKKCGFFNEAYQKYGMEHVDWSMKPAEFGLQPKGFIDFTGSNEYVMIHAESSSVPDRGEYYRKNKELFTSRKEQHYVQASDDSIVPKITYVIPCRDFERLASIKTIVNGVIGQSFPEIQIILVEQDVSQKIKASDVPTVDYLFVGDTNRGLFNKSKAFNKGVFQAQSEYLILHDADMLSRVDYTETVYNLLQKHACLHICGKVLYLNVETTNATNAHNKLPIAPVFERMIGYFEGGSLAVRTGTYWKIGAFNEDYWGYGCEDCDFYTRIESDPTWLCTEQYDLVHLWHSRTPNWNDHHNENKKLEVRLSLLPVEKRIELQIKQLRDLGYGDKL